MEILSVENIGVELLRYRKEHKLTLSQMVDKLACNECKSIGFLSEIERGLKKANASMVFSFEKLRAQAADPREQYGVSAVHRTLTPDQERALQILDSAPEARRLLERFMLLDDEGERAIIMGEVEKLLYEKRRRSSNQ